MPGKAPAGPDVVCPRCHGAGRVAAKGGGAPVRGDAPYGGPHPNDPCLSCGGLLRTHMVRQVSNATGGPGRATVTMAVLLCPRLGGHR